MDKIEVRTTIRAADEAPAPSNRRKSQSLRLEKQTVRTLTGAELTLVGGGCHVGCSVSHPTLTL